MPTLTGSPSKTCANLLPNTAEQNIDRLVLGTAQLGTKYGVANLTGKPDQGEAANILQMAWQSGIRTLDTAQAYGNSEEVIGHFLQANPQCPFNVITKLVADIDPTNSQTIRDATAKSLARLGCKPAGLLLHSGKMLNAWNGPLGDTLTDLKGHGEIGELGVSVYEPEEFRLALSIPEITLIQAPFNVLDQRLLRNGLLDIAREQGRRVFLRSAFLQGLLLFSSNDLPAQFNFAKNDLAPWWDCLDHFGLDALGTTLKYLLQTLPEMEIVIGCETPVQLKEIIQRVQGSDLGPDILASIAALPQAPNRLANPALW